MARMRRFLPKSLNGYLLLGLGVFALPLLAAITHATIQLQRLTASGQRLVLESVQVTRLSQDLYEQLAQLERTARLYAVVGDPQLLAAYDSRDVALGTLLGDLRVALHSDAARQALAAMQRSRALAATGMHGQADGNSPADGIATVVELGVQASRVAALINAGIDSELADLGERTAAARRELLLEAALLLPLALAAVLSFYFGISRPIREVDRAITELGGGDFANPIAVRGPSDLQRLGAQLEWLRHRLLELAQERNRFLRHMSHELKTPLANLREGTELLMEGAVGELGSGQREVTAILQENSIKLQRMIENLLSFSAWQSNSTGLDLSEFPLRPLVRQVLENQQLTLVSQRVRLDVKVQDILLGADRGKLRLILENLLSNAIKYSPRGGTIWVRARIDGDSCVLEVADAGAGIPQAERPGVFEAFQTGRAPSGHIRGTGIGLSVVHEFVQVHSGHIDIVDGEFPGAHFRIRLPLRTRPHAHAA
jgi:two-component system sensor histidine kinase GlrK